MDLEPPIASPTSPRPGAPVRTETFRKSRPDIVGGETPSSPYPIYLSGIVHRGFGRGGKELGCPTANLSDDSLSQIPPNVTTGIYYGYAQIAAPGAHLPQQMSSEDGKVLPMVMSLGWNPYYKNEKLTAEVHIMHEFKYDFYEHPMKVAMLGYIRPELDYTSREDLIDDIDKDKLVGLKSLNRPAYKKYIEDPFFN